MVLSKYVRFQKHPLVHEASKGNPVAVKRLEQLTKCVELLMDNPSKIQDICASVEYQVAQEEGNVNEEKWPTKAEFKTFGTVPRSWLWQYMKNKNSKFTAQWIEAAEEKHHNIVREIMAYAVGLDSNQAMPEGAHDQLVLSRVLNARPALVY